MQTNTLHKIQTLAKVGRVLSAIAYVVSIIGVIGTAVGIGGLAVFGEKFVAGDTAADSLGTVGEKLATRGDAVVGEAGLNIPTMIAAMCAGMVVCIALAVVCGLAKKYFANEIADGTPFTLRGAKELTRLGAVNIIAPIVASMLGNGGVYLAAAINSGIDASKAAIEDSMGSNIALGVMFLVLSLFCRLGAEMSQGKDEAAAEAAPEAAAEAAEQVIE